MLTFDDGHQSWHRHALPLLRECRLPATFFVTSDLVGARADFCSWTQLAELAQGGMAVQAHGQTHRFFDDLSAGEAHQEFGEAQAAIARHTGQSVQALSFPGGRYTRRDLAIGRAAGYRLFFSSDVGTNAPARVARGEALRRMAIRRETSLALFERIVAADAALMLRVSTIAAAKFALRRVIGNQRYQAWYERFSV
jgi:peptidoglycan/xylan/chitin deacetylase (PgdA/CDA1 family)